VKQPARILITLMSIPALTGLAQNPASSRPEIFDFIRTTWDTLTRSHATLAVAAADPKLPKPANGRWPVYISREENPGRIETELRREMPSADFQTVELRVLSADLSEPAEAGLLYLPHPYVVPGGRFNEMYGWDSYFIQMGLLRDDLLPLAKDMADNFLYEIRYYGKILNANRTYYLSRSQPPFLTSMLLAVFARTQDRKWLANSLPEVEKYYRYWTEGPHLVSETGLSRYCDLGEGPAPEVVASEHDLKGHNQYELARRYYRTHRVAEYDLRQYYDAAADKLTPLFYKGDRSMRESGFDPSGHFGPFSIDIIHYNPVCLNSLLYLMEAQTAEILDDLGRKEESRTWLERSKKRARTINSLLWDERDGMYFDYDFVHRRLHRYPYLTTFYPLWAGIATSRQAARVVASLRLFEKPGGLQTSTKRSGDQWDAPFGWAPTEWIAVQGLRRYGYNAEADRISHKFLSMIEQQYERTGTIVEKYDVARRSIELSREIHFGYSTDEVGFGWTNAVFESLSDELRAESKQR
jgi:alpha,alpha-trehalase